MRYPRLSTGRVRQSSIERFYGYDCRPGAAEGSFCETENLSNALFPLLSTRKPRGDMGEIAGCQGLISKDALIWVSEGRLYINGEATELCGMSEGEKQLVSMGACVCVFPDRLYYNTADPTDFGPMEADWSFQGSMRWAMCGADGQEYPPALWAETPPDAPADGELWVCGSEGTLSRYSEASDMWLAVETVYLRLSFATQGQIPALFSLYDGVEISVDALPGLEGTKVIYALGGSSGTENSAAENDYIVLVSDRAVKSAAAEGRARLRRRVPEMDFVCQCSNRLWGCRYGNDGTKNINELYACALGDFRNWEQFMGLSTDSWRSSVGSDGPWTGAAAYLGAPLFFKEDRIHRVGISAIGAHSVTEMPGRGVQRGSHKSLCVVGDTLYYKSPTEVCAYQGGFGQGVSAALGDKRYHSAAAGSIGELYYISMCSADGGRELFVYDTGKGLWMRQDALPAEHFACWQDELCCAAAGRLIALGGSLGEKEEELCWRARTGILAAGSPGQKYISRLILRLAMEKDSEAELFVEYDSGGVWDFAGRIVSRRTGSVELPLRLHRCDHLRLELRGRGAMKLFSLTREMSGG